MKLTSMNSRDRRALTLGAVIAVPGLLGPFVVKPYLHVLSAVQQQTSDERDKLSNDQRAIAGLPAIPAVRARTSLQLDKELNRLFQSRDELVSTGDLAQYVAKVAQDNGIRLQQSETRPAQPVVPGVQALQLQIHAEGDLDGLLHFLNQLETGGKLIRVGALSIDGGRGPLDVPQNTITSPLRSFNTTGIGEDSSGDGNNSNNNRGGGNAVDASRALGAEVLSLSASIYGYRMSDTKWLSVNTEGKSAPSPFTRTPYSFESLDAIVNHDPFSATRTRPSPSYQVAMNQSLQPQPVKPRVRPFNRQQQRLHVVGTVLDVGRNSFAMCQTGNTTTRAVHIGEQIDGYTLTDVRRGVAMFTDPDGGHVSLRTDADRLDSQRRRRRNQGGGQQGGGQQGGDQPGANGQQGNAEPSQSGDNDNGKDENDILQQLLQDLQGAGAVPTGAVVEGPSGGFKVINVQPPTGSSR